MRTVLRLLLFGLCVCRLGRVLGNNGTATSVHIEGRNRDPQDKDASADQEDAFSDRVQERLDTGDEDAEAEWLLQLEDLLFSTAPSEQNKATAIQGMHLLYDELLESLPANRLRRSLNLKVDQDYATSEVEEQEEGEPVELIDTEALASAADAAFMLAVLAATGIASPHVPFNDSWAVRALHAAAQGGSPEANLALAHRYFMADGLPGSCQEGLRRARIVADEYVVATEGSTSPELPLEAVSLRLRQRHGSYEDLPSEDAWLQLQLQAEMLNFGDGYQRMMGYRQLLGYDMEAEPVAAMQHFQAAAAQGDVYATFNLGYMHMKGIGTEANVTAAKANFEVAARKGIPSAFNGLGVLYFEGYGGGVVDYAAAYEAFARGAELGDPDAMFNLATLYAGGHGVPKNHSLAHVHYLDAHDAGHWRAPHALAITHQRGLGVEANCSAAREYIQTFVRERSGWADQMDEALLAVDAGSEWLAIMRYAVVAVQGSAIAQSNLAWLLQRSSSFDSQHRRQMCLRLLSQAAKSGLLDAWVDAGDIQYHNDCPGEAVRLYTLAGEAGSIEGLYSLGWMHAVGQNVTRNSTRAAELYRQAVQQAPDWRHAAPPFLALLLLPMLLASQWLKEWSPMMAGLYAPGLQSIFQQTHKAVVQLSWDTWALTAAAASLAWVLWRRHKRLLQLQQSSHTRTNSETGVG